ncbi:MAG: hypothetical protein Kow00128_16780 [Deltaproteobacteria bacterium]
MRFRPARSIALAALLLLAAIPIAAQKRSVESLCRLHGIGQEESVARIKAAYLDAVRSGISEEELLPFVEDILRHKLDCSQMVRVLAVTTKLKAAGLPYFVVFSKVREGVAKMAPPALVVDVAEAKLKSLTESRDVLVSLESSGYRVRDFQNAAVIVSSYIEKGYRPGEVVSQVRNKGIEGAGFAALSAVVEKPVKRKER